MQPLGQAPPLPVARADTANGGPSPRWSELRAYLVFGGSWVLLNVLVKVDYQLLPSARPKTLAQFFAQAGYRTVLAQPGTTRPFDRPDYLQFEQAYAAWDFDYRDPHVGWGKLPDQCVVDPLHRREIARAAQPLFAVIALVTSHAPWNERPRLLEDFSAIGDGAIYAELEPVRHGTSWAALSAARPAYLDCVAYDLAVLERYVVRFVPDDSLVVILGDHQPVASVTDHSPKWGVPVHVISRNRRLVDRLVRGGYRPGVYPPERARNPGLDSFLPAFLCSVSSPDPGDNVR